MASKHKKVAVTMHKKLETLNRMDEGKLLKKIDWVCSWNFQLCPVWRKTGKKFKIFASKYNYLENGKK